MSRPYSNLVAWQVGPLTWSKAPLARTAAFVSTAAVVSTAALATTTLLLSTVACDANVNIELLPLDTSRAEPSTVASSAVASSDAGQIAEPSSPNNGSTSATVPSSSPLSDGGSALVSPLHHYDFEGEGTTVPDLVGSATATLIGGGTLTTEGALELDGVDDYVDLPNGILSNLQAVTITLLLTWHGGPCWQRLLDFGSSVTEEGTASAARTSLLVTPASCSDSHLGPVEPNVLSLMFHAPGNYTLAQDVNPFPSGAPTFVALSVDVDGTLRLSTDGRTVIESGGALRLADLVDVNNWIGRSQWEQDATLKATLFDLRIYDVALTETQVDRLFGQLSSDFNGLSGPSATP